METISRAQRAFKKVQETHPMYQAQADWTPALFDTREKLDELFAWLEEQGHKRGDSTARNDWLYPTGGLILFRESRVAVEAKLRFG